MAHRNRWIPHLPIGVRDILIASLALMVEGDTGPMDSLTPSADRQAAELLAELRVGDGPREPVRKGALVTKVDIDSWRAKRRAGRSIASIAREAGRPYTTVYEWISREGKRRNNDVREAR